MQALRMKTQNFKHKTQNQIDPKFSGCNLQKRYMHNFFFFFFSFFFLKCAWYVGCNIIHDNDNTMSQNKFVLKTFEVDDHDEIMSL